MVHRLSQTTGQVHGTKKSFDVVWERGSSPKERAGAFARGRRRGIEGEEAAEFCTNRLEPAFPAGLPGRFHRSHGIASLSYWLDRNKIKEELELTSGHSASGSTMARLKLLPLHMIVLLQMPQCE